MFNFEQYLRDNPMPTKRINQRGYRIVEVKCERIDSKQNSSQRGSKMNE